MSKVSTSQLDRQREALRKAEMDAYQALRKAEDELFSLEDRVARRGDRPSPEGR